ncbi:hypothetical protein [Aliarcobacter butzleri]|nr:hypothetical protein [Aliarcobacter butzleri]
MFAKPISASKTAIFKSFWANKKAILAVKVDFPTPPFPEVIVKSLVLEF